MLIESILSSLVPNADLVSRKILVEGNEVPGQYHFISITIQNGINKIPTAMLLLSDCSEKKEDFTVASIDDFKPGKKIEIKMGYHGNNETVFKGMIVKNSPKITGQCAEMTIECKDEVVKMTATKNHHYFTDRKDSDIVNELLDNNAITDKEVVDTTIRHEQLVQQNLSDWDFMISRIDVSGAMCLIDNGKFIVRKPKPDEQPKLSLAHGANILEFNAEMDSRIQSDQVKIYTWDFDKQEVREIENDEPDATVAAENPNATSVSELAGVLSKPYEMRTAYLSEEEQKEIANAKKVKQILSKIKGKVKYTGLTAAKPGDFINLDGVGDRFNGNAFVSAIEHEYADGNWTTEATLGWDENFFAESVNPMHPASATGQMSFAQGLHTAVVKKIIDESGQYRMKVHLALMNNEEEGIYARVATLDAGNQRGTFFRPEIGDEVLVGFMNDDPRHPVILGMLHSGGRPAPLEPEEANNEKGYVSRSGIKMVFNDEKKSILIETPGSRFFRLDDDDGTITIEDGNSNKIVMDANGISIESVKDLTLKANKSIAMSAPEISIKADASAILESNGSSVIKSSGITEVKGSMVRIN